MQEGFLRELERKLEERREKPTGSLSSKLVQSRKAASIKLSEECSELFCAIRSESDARVAQEAADVLFAVVCALVCRGVPLQKVAGVLASRRVKRVLKQKFGDANG